MTEKLAARSCVAICSVSGAKFVTISNPLKSGRWNVVQCTEKEIPRNSMNTMTIELAKPPEEVLCEWNLPYHDCEILSDKKPPQSVLGLFEESVMLLLNSHLIRPQFEEPKYSRVKENLIV